MDALAVTDTNGLYGLVWFLEFARAAGVRPIVGAEAVWGDERAVVLVKDREGYAGLCRMLSDLHRALGPTVGSEGRGQVLTYNLRARSCDNRAEPVRRDGSSAGHRPRPDPFFPFDFGAALVALPPGVVILTPREGLLERLACERGASDLYGELRPDEDPRRRASLKAFLKRRGLPPVATGAVHFADPEEHDVHRLLRTIATKRGLSPFPGKAECPPSCWLAPRRVMEARHPDLPEAVENAARIADRCRFVPELGRPIFADYPTPDGRDASAWLERLCLEGVRRRYGAMTPAIRERLHRELAVVREKGFAPYFLVVREIVEQAPRTCGRGSAAASLVSFLLGITHVDPIRHDLYFERFLNPGRVDPPDIDVDFPWDERDDVLQWTFERFGLARTAMIANHNTFRARMAVREVAKVFGLPEAEIARVSRRFPWHADDPVETVESHPMFRGLDLPEPWPTILRLARKIVGAPRHLSVHCGGVVIVPDEVERYVPVQPAPKGVRVIQWEKDQAEEAGFVKVDLLGNRSLSVIRDACREVELHGGGRTDFLRFDPTGDPATRDLLARGETMGVFYVESPAMRQLQAKCGKGDFEHLVLHSSIIRPAANVWIQEYIRRLEGGSWEPLHPALEELLRESYGVMVYQEHVSQAAVALAGFDLASADDLRKVLSKKHRQARLADYRERFFAGARARGAGEEAVARIWDMILSFAGYSFCKPHSASYAMVSFQSAWLRAHHPAEFMAAVISNQGGYYSTFAYVSECRRMGLRVLPPCVNVSERPWTGEAGAVRVGLMQLKGFPESALGRLLEERRRGGPYRSFEELLERMGEEAAPEAVRILALSGALDALLPAGASRADLMWRLLVWARRRSGRRAGRSLFAAGALAEPGRLLGAGPYDERTLLEHEIETLGLLVSRHPLTLWSEAIRRSGAVAARDLPRHAGREVRVVGWYVTGKPVFTRRGEPMEFLSFEDTTALYETAFFPRAYARFCATISRTRPYLLAGRVEENHGVVSLNVHDVGDVSPTHEKGTTMWDSGGG